MSSNPYIGILFTLVFLTVMFVVISYLFFVQSGWRTLWKSYRVEDVPLTQAWHWESVVFSSPYSGLLLGGWFGRCITVGYSDRGIFFKGEFPFLILSPFLIPWSDVVLGSIDGFSVSSSEVPTVGIEVSKQVYDGLKGSGFVRHFDGLGELLQSG